MLIRGRILTFTIDTERVQPISRGEGGDGDQRAPAAFASDTWQRAQKLIVELATVAAAIASQLTEPSASEKPDAATDDTVGTEPAHAPHPGESSTRD